jgi:uncharacterized membrane protein YgcG
MDRRANSRKKASVATEADLLFRKTCESVECAGFGLGAPTLGVVERRSKERSRTQDEASNILRDIREWHKKLKEMQKGDGDEMVDFYGKLEKLDYELLVAEGMWAMIGHIRDDFKPSLDLSESLQVVRELHKRLLEEREALLEKLATSASKEKYALPEHGNGIRYRETFDASDDEGGEEEGEGGSDGASSVDGEEGSAPPFAGGGTSGGRGGSGLPDIVKYGKARTAAK